MPLSAIRSLLLLCCIGCTSTATASDAAELVRSCRSVAAAAEPARRIWLERDLFAYEMQRALGASAPQMHRYRANLRETCARVAHNNAVYRRLGARATRVRQNWRPSS